MAVEKEGENDTTFSLITCTCTAYKYMPFFSNLFLFSSFSSPSFVLDSPSSLQLVCGRTDGLSDCHPASRPAPSFPEHAAKLLPVLGHVQ